MEPLFSVIIPVLNNWQLTRDCLQSLRDHTPGDEFEVIVVDNGSSDETVPELASLGERLFPGRFVRIRFEENRNFGPACNTGARAAAAPLLFFLNNDTVATSGWSEPLLEALRTDGSLGAVGPLLLYPDDTVQHLGVTITPSGVDHLYKGIPAGHPLVGKRRRLQCLTGAALLVSRDLFEDIGGFYDGYCNGCEDLELGVRIRGRGRKLACIPASKIYHLESKTPGRMDREKDNLRLLFERCGDGLAVDVHKHALDDGFTVRLNDWDDIDVLTAPTASELLFSSIRPDNPALLAALLRQNPYWLQGAERLRDLQEGYGAVAAALEAAWRAMEIHPTLKGCKKALSLAARIGNFEHLGACETVLRALVTRRNDLENRRRRLERIIERARRHNDIFLEALYRERLREVAADGLNSELN